MIESCCDRYYCQVGANSYESSEYIVPDGRILYVKEVGGNSALASDVHVKLCWNPGGDDEACLFATHGDDKQKTALGPFIGNGTKCVRISLNNDSSQTETIGCWWNGFLK